MAQLRGRRRTTHTDELEYTDLDPQDAAANHEADHLGDIEHTYHISEAGQHEQLELTEQACLNHEANVKYWNDIKMEEAATAWAKGTNMHGN